MTTRTLNDIVLLAAADLVESDVTKEFTAEDLVVAAWKFEPSSFGLRGHEEEYPDSNKLYTKIDGRSGLVAKGYLEKAGERTLRLTERGLAAAIRLNHHSGGGYEAKLARILQERIQKILDHPVFQEWLGDPSSPKKFRGAGQFWGIAPGTPASVVRTRVAEIDRVLATAQEVVEKKGIGNVVSQRGQTLFDAQDIQRAAEFQAVLKQRFRNELKTMDPSGCY